VLLIGTKKGWGFSIPAHIESKKFFVKTSANDLDSDPLDPQDLDFLDPDPDPDSHQN